MSCLPKLLDICLACEWSTHVCSLVLRSGSARSAGPPALARSLSALPGRATQPPVRSLPVGCCVTAHILLRSPTADAVIPLASVPPLPPPAFSHSSPSLAQPYPVPSLVCVWSQRPQDIVRTSYQEPPHHFVSPLADSQLR